VRRSRASLLPRAARAPRLAVVLAAAASAALACASGPRSGPAGLDADGLRARNDEEVLALGAAAEQRGDDAAAAAAFDLLAVAFPASPHAAPARYRAGLAWRRLGRWDEALARFEAVERDAGSGGDADEASFLAAECLYRLGRHAEARARLDRLAARAGLAAAQRGRALTQRAVIELEDGEPAAAERTIRLALEAADEARREVRVEPYYPAKARYVLGEVYRAYGEAIRLDPAQDAASLADALERRAQLLLAAQEQYLAAIRAGDAGWAVAAASRIGDLYDGLYTAMTQAPPPPGLDTEAAGAYRDELRRNVRVLVTKAIEAYEETLAAAQRVGVEGDLVASTREALERMRRALDEADGEAAPAPESR
jgi:tetratricopeptide (TPR) repeat protein